MVLEAVAKPDRDSGVTRRASRGGGATERPNKELKLTKPEHNGASQLNSSVGPTFASAKTMTIAEVDDGKRI